jgi:hypothetical protein
MERSEKRMVHCNARRWADLRQAARVARTEGVTLIVHRDGAVTVCGEKDNRSPAETYQALREAKQRKVDATVTTETRKPTQAETASEARRKLPKASNEERLQRQQQRHQERLREHLKARACGERWLPLVQYLLRRSRAEFRGDVWAGHMRHTLALRDKWRGLVGRACAQGVRECTTIVRRAQATVRLRSLFAAYQRRRDIQARDAMLRGFMLRDRLHHLLHGYRITRNFDAAEDGLVDEPSSSCPELSPPGRRISSCRHLHESPDDCGAQRAENRPKKTRGGRSRRR